MYLRAKIVKSLAKAIDFASVTHTPDMGMFPHDLTHYKSRCAVERLIKKTGKDKAIESLLMKYFMNLAVLLLKPPSSISYD